jgi:hypothetical protein
MNNKRKFLLVRSGVASTNSRVTCLTYED